MPATIKTKLHLHLALYRRVAKIVRLVIAGWPGPRPNEQTEKDLVSLVHNIGAIPETILSKTKTAPPDMPDGKPETLAAMFARLYAQHPDLTLAALQAVRAEVGASDKQHRIRLWLATHWNVEVDGGFVHVSAAPRKALSAMIEADTGLKNVNEADIKVALHSLSKQVR